MYSMIPWHLGHKETALAVLLISFQFGAVCFYGALETLSSVRRRL